MTNNRTATFKQACHQAPGLALGAIEWNAAIAYFDRAQIDITAPRLPGRCRRQQGRRTRAEHTASSLETKRGLLTRAAHEFAHTEIGDGLGQATLEFVTFDFPFDTFQTRLEGDSHCRQTGKHAEQG